MKKISLTLLFSLLLVLVISGSFYTIYCYGIYDNKVNNRIVEAYNTFKFDELYKYYNVSDSEYLKKDSFKSITDLMYNKINLGKIYDLYYADSKIYKSRDDFINKYYYGNGDINEDEVAFNYNGKTTLFTRRQVSINGINVKNSVQDKSYLGLVSNINFTILDGGSIQLDGKDVDCVKTVCNIKEAFGGVHSITYNYLGFTYYSIINIVESNMNFVLENLDNLVTIDTLNKKTNETLDKLINGKTERKNLSNGIYGLTKCMKSSGCPATRYTYITLNTDGTCRYYFYITLDKAGDTYDGTYEISNGFLNLYFKKHTYSVFDYDTQEKTDIEANIDVKMTFKINDENSFSNQEYVFLKK